MKCTGYIWFYVLPESKHIAQTFYEYKTEREVRAMLRIVLNVNRLPKGVVIWKT